jgi:hypothetical protein
MELERAKKLIWTTFFNGLWDDVEDDVALHVGRTVLIIAGGEPKLARALINYVPEFGAWSRDLMWGRLEDMGEEELTHAYKAVWVVMKHAQSEGDHDLIQALEALPGVEELLQSAFDRMLEEMDPEERVELVQTVMDWAKEAGWVEGEAEPQG